VPSFKPAYLIHGDDHGRIGERRARLRALAGQQSGAGGVELLEGDTASAELAARALAALTFAIGRRFIIVDGAERFGDRDVAEHLVPALAAMPPDTTIAFFAREEGRNKASAKLAEAVVAAGGDVAAEMTLKEWQLPKWVGEQARGLELSLDADAARALVAQVGDRQQRLARELEKLALEAGPGATLDAEAIEARAAGQADRRAWLLADALVARDARRALRLYLRLRSQGETIPSLSYWMARRVREAHAVVQRLEAGESAASVRRSLRMPPKAAERFLADAQRSDAWQLRSAIAKLADLELETRGGAALDSDTQALRAIVAIAA
jgi:DNA polymerase-3 subunit delta